MKVTIEFDSVSDRGVLKEVLAWLPDSLDGALPPVEPLWRTYDEKSGPSALATDELVAGITDVIRGLALVEPMAVPAPPTSPSLDADGLPWDGRIHSSSKALLADGRWRQRRNTDPAVVAAVTAELRAVMSSARSGALAVDAAHTERFASIVPPPPAEPTELFARPEPALVVTHAVPPPVDPSPFGTSTEAGFFKPHAVDNAMSFPEFMKAITAARIAPGVVLEACKAVGMPSIPALNQRPDLIPQVAAALGVA
jgi:hypothetical protein